MPQLRQIRDKLRKVDKGHLLLHGLSSQAFVYPCGLARHKEHAADNHEVVEILGQLTDPLYLEKRRRPWGVVVAEVF